MPSSDGKMEADSTRNGWLNVGIDEDQPDEAWVCIMHHRCHQPYTDISVPKDVEDVVKQFKDMSAAQVRVNPVIKRTS